jgi:hypothetical protein
VQLYREPLLDVPLQAGAPPPHHTVFFSIRAFLNKSGKFGFLRCIQPARPSRCLAVFKPGQASRIVAMHPIPQRLAVHPAGFGRGVAILALKHQRNREHPPPCLCIAGHCCCRPQLSRCQIRPRDLDCRHRRLLCATAMSQTFSDSGIAPRVKH